MRQALKATGCVLAVLAAVVCLLIGTIVGCAVWYYTVGGPDAGKLQHQLETDLPPGTSLAGIYRYLGTKGKDKGIDYTPKTSTAEYNSIVSDAGFPDDTPVLNAIQRDGGPNAGSGLTIDFVLDHDMHLQRIIVKRYDTLP